MQEFLVTVDYTQVPLHLLRVLIRVALPAGVVPGASPWVPNTLAKQIPLWPTGVKPSSSAGNCIRTVRTDALPFSRVSTAIFPADDWKQQKSQITLRSTTKLSKLTKSESQIQKHKRASRNRQVTKVLNFLLPTSQHFWLPKVPTHLAASCRQFNLQIYK